MCPLSFFFLYLSGCSLRYNWEEDGIFQSLSRKRVSFHLWNKGKRRFRVLKILIKGSNFQEFGWLRLHPSFFRFSCSSYRCERMQEQGRILQMGLCVRVDGMFSSNTMRACKKAMNHRNNKPLFQLKESNCISSRFEARSWWLWRLLFLPFIVMLNVVSLEPCFCLMETLKCFPNSNQITLLLTRVV